MEILVTFITTNKRGQPQRDQRRIDASLLSIGRGSKSQIHLPDARVALDHARITITDTGPTIDAVDGRVEVNGSRIDRAQLATGDVIEIGPYELRIEEAIAATTLALSVSAGPGFSGPESVLRRMVLRTPGPSKRRLSYLAFAGVLLLSLVVPLATDLWDDPSAVVPEPQRAIMREVIPAVAAKFLQAWNPGPVSNGHQIFGADCRSCHQHPFVQVRDAACLSCHKNVLEHVAREDLGGPRGMEFLETRCASCHRDHKGTQLAPRSQELCASCHVDVKAAAPNAQSDNVTDFWREHPEFRLSLLDADHPKVIRRVRQGNPRPAGMVERSNLKFNHEKHLDPAGVRGPEKRRTVMDCSDCHQPADGGRLMAPVTMERHCQRCHSLAFELKVTERQVPHGSGEAVVTMLREFYARLVLGDVPPGVTPPPDLVRMRPGAVLDYQDRQQALRIADERAQRVLRELYTSKGPREVCSKCHSISREGAQDWKVAPVKVATEWMPGAKFSHAKHRAEKCSSCHDVTRSKVSSDIAMPSISRCRECHVGGRPVDGKTTSDCAKCHEFHAGRDFWHKALQTDFRSKAIK